MLPKLFYQTVNLRGKILYGVLKLLEGDVEVSVVAVLAAALQFVLKLRTLNDSEKT